MLILTRRIGETLNIGDDIKVTILSINGRQVRIGIDAPKEIPIHREEIYQRVQTEKRLGITRTKEPTLKIPMPSPSRTDKAPPHEPKRD